MSLALERRAASHGKSQNLCQGCSTGNVHRFCHYGNGTGRALISGIWVSGGPGTAKGFRSPTRGCTSLNTSVSMSRESHWSFQGKKLTEIHREIYKHTQMLTHMQEREEREIHRDTNRETDIQRMGSREMSWCLPEVFFNLFLLWNHSVYSPGQMTHDSIPSSSEELGSITINLPAKSCLSPTATLRHSSQLGPNEYTERLLLGCLANQ